MDLNIPVLHGLGRRHVEWVFRGRDYASELEDLVG